MSGQIWVIVSVYFFLIKTPTRPLISLFNHTSEALFESPLQAQGPGPEVLWLTHHILAGVDVRLRRADLPSARYFTLAPGRMSLCDTSLMENKKECRSSVVPKCFAVSLLGAHCTGGLGLSMGRVPLVTHLSALCPDRCSCPRLLTESLRPFPSAFDESLISPSHKVIHSNSVPPTGQKEEVLLMCSSFH